MQFVILMMEESLMNVLLELGQAYAQIVLKDFRAPQRGGIFFFPNACPRLRLFPILPSALSGSLQCLSSMH